MTHLKTKMAQEKFVKKKLPMLTKAQVHKLYRQVEKDCNKNYKKKMY